MASSHQNTRVIEFVGLQGSGKSTIATELCRVLKEDDIPCILRKPFFADKAFVQKLLWRVYLLKFLRLNMLSVLTIRHSDTRTKETGLGGKLNLLYFYLAVRHHQRALERTSGAGVVICEEGVVQKLAVFVALDILDKEKANAIATSLIPRESIFVFVKLSRDEAMDRQNKRGKVVPFSKDSHLVDQFYDVAIWLVERVRVNTDSTILYIDATRSPEENARAIDRNF